MTWSIKLQVPPGTEPGPKTIRCQAGYQICNDQTCAIPGQWTLPDVTLTVVPGVAEPEAEAAPPAGTQQPPAAHRRRTEVVSEVAKQAESGLVPFLLFSRSGGLSALVMPCVWPMVPITVNFFVKQGQHKGRTTGLAIAYCLAIIGVFTSIGVLCSFFFSATALQNLANNAWLNIAVALLFLAFGLSLLGVFEIRLPSFLLNASAQGESRGGLVGVMFMALTLTITSFTCTFPVVGGLIVMAAGGQFFYPIIGLATFSDRARLAVLPAGPLAGPAVEDAQERRLDERGQDRRRPDRDRRGVQVHQHGRDRLRCRPGGRLVQRPGGPVALGGAGRRLRRLPARPVPHRPRSRGGAGRARADPDRACSSSPSPCSWPPPSSAGRPRASSGTPSSACCLPTPISSPRPRRRRRPGRRGRLRGGQGPVARSRDRRARAEELSRRAVGDEPRGRPGAGQGRGPADPDRLHRASTAPIAGRWSRASCPGPRSWRCCKKFVTVQLYTDFVPIDSLTPDQREELAGKNQDLIIKMARDDQPVLRRPDARR